MTAHVNAKIFKVEAPQPQNQGGKFIRPLLYTVKPRFYRIATESNPPCTANSCHFQYTNVTDCWLSYIYCSQIHSISTVVDNSQSTSYLCRISRKNEKKSPRLKSDIWSSFACDRKLEAVLCCVSVCLSVCVRGCVTRRASMTDPATSLSFKWRQNSLATRNSSPSATSPTNNFFTRYRPHTQL